jgi:hypothetical protein
MPEDNLKAVLDEHNRDVALIVGNGTNRFRQSRATSSWDKLLLDLSCNYFGERKKILAG